VAAQPQAEKAEMGEGVNMELMLHEACKLEMKNLGTLE